MHFPSRSVKSCCARTLVGSVLCISLSGAMGWGQTPNSIPAISAALRSGDFDSALRLSTEALSTSPSDIRLLTLQGIAYAHESALALASFRKALEISPNYLPALEGAAQTGFEEGGETAKPFLTRLLALKPDDLTSNAMLAVVEYRAADCKEAVEHFQKAQATFADQPNVLMMYGACLASINRVTDAIPVLQQSVQLDEKNPVARYDLSLAQWNANKPKEALETLGPLLEDEFAPEDVLTLAADMYEAENDTQHAVSVLRRAILAHPKNKAAYLQFAYLSYKHSSVQVGIDMLNVGISQLPKEADLYLSRGILLSQTSDPSHAMSDFETANRLDPNLSFASDAEGIARSQMHDSTAALVTFKTAVRQHPKDGLTQFLLAEAISQSEPTPSAPTFAEGVAAAKRSIALDPGRVEAHDLLASFYLRAGKMNLSVQECEESLKLDPNDEQALYHEILALRAGDKKAEVPALVKRMMKIKQAKATEVKPKIYLLVEDPPNPTTEQPK